MSRDLSKTRRFSRITFDSSVQIASGENRWETKLLDICLNGAMAIQPAQWSGDKGMDCTLSIKLGADGPTVIMESTMVHAEKGRLGFRCNSIDVDSITHLRRLVELNLGDAKLADRELSALLERSAATPTGE